MQLLTFLSSHTHTHVLIFASCPTALLLRPGHVLSPGGSWLGLVTLLCGLGGPGQVDTAHVSSSHVAAWQGAHDLCAAHAMPIGFG